MYSSKEQSRYARYCKFCQSQTRRYQCGICQSSTLSLNGDVTPDSSLSSTTYNTSADSSPSHSFIPIDSPGYKMRCQCRYPNVRAGICQTCDLRVTGVVHTSPQRPAPLVAKPQQVKRQLFFGASKTQYCSCAHPNIYQRRCQCCHKAAHPEQYCQCVFGDPRGFPSIRQGYCAYCQLPMK